MKLVLFGATGMVGSRIAAEAVARGHEVTAVSRSGREPLPRTRAVAADARDSETVAGLAAEHDAVASALVPPRDGSDPREPFIALYDTFLRGLRAGGATRLLVVGGAGSLEVSPGELLVDTPDFPPEFRGEAHAHHDVLTRLRGCNAELDWTYISPAAEIAPGERTGTFRLGGDVLLIDSERRSRISAEDYAVAFVDELEQDAHPRRRMSVAY
ncbi:NAD(P)-dependent oxidoreductase [Actinomycetota bacterium Odt1-20B]